MYSNCFPFITSFELRNITYTFSVKLFSRIYIRTNNKPNNHITNVKINLMINLFYSFFYNSSSSLHQVFDYRLFHHDKVFFQVLFGFVPTSLLSIVPYWRTSTYRFSSVCMSHPVVSDLFGKM